MEYKLEPHERRKQTKDGPETKKSGYFSLILVQLILCVLTAIFILFGNLIFSGSANKMKDYYVDHIQSDNSLEDEVKSVMNHIINFLNQPASKEESSDGSSSLGSSSSSQSSESNSESSSASDSSNSLLSSAAGGEVNPVWEQTAMDFSPISMQEGDDESVATCVPLHGAISCGYGYRLHPITGLPDFHKGVDIPAEEGTPILAAMDGTVITAATSASFGNYVVIQHENSLVTRYGHCCRLNVEEGQQVHAGDVIGFVGNTGYSTGNHLHFDVSKDGTYFDPHQLFPTFD